MTTTFVPPIKLLERVGKRVILSMNADVYECILEDIEMTASREKLVKRYKDSAES